MKNKLRIPRWHDVLIEIYKNKQKSKYCQRLNRKINGSLNYLRIIVKELEKHNLIEIIPTKKIRKIEITPKGNKVATAILSIKSELV